jgi:hypothetical protein
MLEPLQPRRDELASEDAVAPVCVSACLSLLGAAIWPLPSLWRSAPAPDLGWDYLALAGCASASLFAVGLALRVPLSASRRHEPGPSALTLALGLASAPLALLGYALKSATNHRPLGAATFAVVSAMLVALLLLLVSSALALGRRGSTLGRALVYAMGAGGVLSAALTLLWLGRSVMQHATPTRALLDAALGALLVGVLSPIRTAWLAGWPRLIRMGPLLCCVLWLASLWLLRSDLDVRATVKSAPVVAGVVGLVVR